MTLNGVMAVAFCDAIPLSINTAVYLQSFNTRFSVTHLFSVTTANIAINNISLKTTFFFAYIFAAESISVSSTTFT